MTVENPQKIEFEVEGMHCAACEMYLENKIREASGVSLVDADLATRKVTIEYSGDQSREELANEFSNLVRENGYVVKQVGEIVSKKKNYLEYVYGFLIALVLILIYLGFENTGLLRFGSGFELNFITAFFIGVIASVSTCAAVTGGVVLSLSANVSKTNPKRLIVSMLGFHLSRLVTFALLGGFLGYLGSILLSNPDFNFLYITLMLKAFLVVVLFILGISLLDIFPSINALQLRFPKSFATKLLNFEKIHPLILPVFAGFVTFFLPCGFTQSLQISAFSKADFWQGLLLLLGFSLGTMPVLGLISFASTKFSNSIKSGIFYKMAAFLVLALALSELVFVANVVKTWVSPL